MSNTNIVLGDNQFGKAENHLVKVTKNGDRHTIEDLTVISQLHGDFASAYYDGNNEHVVPTDTQKNTVFAFAKDGVGSPEDFLLRLGQHYVDDFEWVTGGRWAARQVEWDRIPVNGEGHDHSFYRGGSGGETRTAVVKIDGDQQYVIAGLEDLSVLKTTQSGFVGFPVDQYTTLQETTDRILATSVTGRWLYNTTDVDFNASYASVKKILLEVFTNHYSRALQETQYLMGKAVLEAHPEIDEIKFSMPNLHHFVVDFTPYGMENDNEVFWAAHSPYGQIEGTLRRESLGDTDKIWKGVPAFV
ncbi:factor-independent urate hydroxylase [Leucobacter chromiireducens]|uniref:Uricase n=1 Tax=Leucobacter chromiireducens subsp. solipictus TaxID=398235 RepID=A0ABS1SD22_9MICO|nr:urate oxidase [Leucobacter chromiireducens]MBL3678447.1 urate oxidase [Leucobacter chromiireducens subsp. solipictus]